MRRAAWSWRHMFCRNSLRHNCCVYIMTMTQPSIFACCPLWGRRCPPIPESYWKKRALKQYTKFFSRNGMAQHALATGFQESIYRWYTAWYISLGLWVSHWLPHHLPWTNHHHPWHPKERRRQDLRLGSERNYEFDPTGAKSCRFPWLKKNGAVLGGELVLRKIKKVSGLHMVSCWFLLFLSIWFWGFLVFGYVFSLQMSKEWRNLGKKTTMMSESQISPPPNEMRTNCERNAGEALAQLLEKTNEAEWPWQSHKGGPEGVGKQC